eukprot:3065069-Pyramimonas_sp.AAC.1
MSVYRDVRPSATTVSRECSRVNTWSSAEACRPLPLLETGRRALIRLLTPISAPGAAVRWRPERR